MSVIKFFKIYMINMRTIIFCLPIVLLLGFSRGNAAIKVKNLANENNIVYINIDKKYLLIPVEDSAPEGELDFVYNNENLYDYTQKIRLSRGKTDYYIPVDMSKFTQDSIIMIIRGVPSNSVCWSDFKESDDMTIDTEKFRPAYHHTPAYGWMNDPNGMFYKDGVYHLFFQYNPYGSMWGNMN